MSYFCGEDEALIQSMLRQLLQSVKEKISGAPSAECAEEILLHLEETDENFHNYEFVKYLRHYIKSCLGSVIEGETEICTSAKSQDGEPGYDTLVQHVIKKTRETKEYKEMMYSLKNVMAVVVESLISKFEDDQIKNKEMQKKTQQEQPSCHYTDNCSDSDSSFNQSYTFMNQEQLQLIADRLNPSQPKEVRQEAMHTLCSAPPSDVLNCESWTTLRKTLMVSLADPDSIFTEKILRFYAKMFSSSPINMTREVYTSLVRHLELYFLSGENQIPSFSSGVDITNPGIARLLKKVRLLNEYQKEAPSFWIRHPEKYMEEIVESTLSLLSVTQEHSQITSQKCLDPAYFLALIDVKAVWFKKWMHAYYSRTVVLRLLEKKYKSLIVASVQQCLYYFESCGSKVGESPKMNTGVQQQHSGEKQKTFYTGQELQYIYFIHSVCLLGRLLMYTHGRKLFPIKLKNRKELMSLTDLVVLFTRAIYSSCAKERQVAHSGSYSPVGLVMEVLRMLCDRKECASECLYTSAVIDALLHPVYSLLSGKQVNVNCDGTTLINIADILARIASIERGLSLLLYGETVNPSRDSVIGAHTIALFTKKLLAEDIAVLSGSEMLPVLKGAFIFVCRQMYNTCEGLHVLIPYGLHESIAESWKKTSLLSERIPTPIAGAASASSSSQELQNVMKWEESLLDNLLNFAATPRGLLLLQQTGAMNECVTYMFSRFTKKLQVSRCEKFGYGVMVTQVAATSPGTVALQSSGFIKALTAELWSVLECGRDDVRVIQPRSTPVDPIDRSCQKSFLALVNMLSSYPAVCELISNQDLPNKVEYSLSEVPTCIIDIIDRLIILNSEAKIHSLFNYEQSHIFGLRLLNVLCCNLDTLLLLESQYKVSEILLKAQKENITESATDPGDFIIDSLSVERNHVLIRMKLVGGPSERILPPRVLNQGSDPYPWPMFSTYPLPKWYLLEIPRKTDVKQDNELSKLLAFLRNSDRKAGCLENCRKQFYKVMKTKPDAISGNNLVELLEKFILHLSESPADCYFNSTEYNATDANMKNESLSSLQKLGIKMTIRYGRYLNLLKDNAEHNLTQVLKHCEKFLTKQQITIKSSLRYLQGGYAGYDWFAATVFLIMFGDKERTLSFLQQFSGLLVSAFLWLPRLHVSIHLPVGIAESGIHPIYFCSAYYIEMLLKAEVPLVFSAFRMSGFTPSQICQHWLTQCFWNYLDWTEICHYITTCILLGPDYQIYMCVSVFKHLQQDILQHTQAQDLQVFLKEEVLLDFHVSNYLEYMESLEQTYRAMILQDMKSIKLQST
uniref:Protein broad-minded n=1 Tax=Geotrypetes seraphini TaxID=260995 RepID=A0A6P8Q592_GEOSA|nr:protein broad-minded isoform X2 [Geotrypetes seraphini]